MTKNKEGIENNVVEKMRICREELQVKKRRVPVKKWRIRKQTKYTDVVSEVPLIREQLSYTEVPFNVEIEKVPEIRCEGDTTIIPVVKEVPVIIKKMVLVKEIHITTLRTTSTETIEAKVRSEEVEITDV